MRKISKSSYVPQNRSVVPMVEGNAFVKSNYNQGKFKFKIAPVAPKRKA
jgi:hypothetical protein